MNNSSDCCFTRNGILWIVLFSILFLPLNCFAIEFHLVDASNNSKIRKLIDNDTIDLEEIGIATPINIQAVLQKSSNCAKLQFNLNNENYRIRTNIEKKAPYSLAGDYPAGNYKTWSVSPGAYELTAKAYDGANVLIEEGTICFTVTKAGEDDSTSSDRDTNNTADNSASAANIIFTMVNPKVPIGNTQDGDLKVLNDNAVVYLEDVSGRFNVRADLENKANSNICKFDFFFDGKMIRAERTKPFSLYGDDNGRYKSRTPATGRHKIRGVAYNDAGAVVSDRLITISVYPNRNSVDNDSVDNDSVDNDSADNDSADNDSADNDSADNDSADNDSADNDSADNDSADNDSADNDSADNDSADNDSADNDSADNDSADNDSTDNDSAETAWPLPVNARIRNKSRDLISLHFDNSPDPDDAHATVADKIIMDKYGLHPHVVSGTYAKYQYQEHRNGVENYQRQSEHVMRAAWGDNWLDAHNHWDDAVNITAQQWLEVLNNGGHVWIAEAGTSDFTAEVIRELQQNQMNDGSAITRQVTRNQIHLVQHGPNAPGEGGYNEALARPDNLSFVKANTDYHKIDNGNKGEGREPDNQDNANADLRTADFRLDNDTLGDYQTRIENFINRTDKLDTKYRAMWNQAFIYYNPLRGTANTCNRVWNDELGRKVEMHSLDFSDTVEVLFILGIGKSLVANPDDFADMFLD